MMRETFLIAFGIALVTILAIGAAVVSTPYAILVEIAK